MRATLGVVMAVCFSAHTTRRAICPDFFSRRMVVDPMVSVSPTFRSTASFVFIAITLHYNFLNRSHCCLPRLTAQALQQRASAGLIAFSTTSLNFSDIRHLFLSNKKPAEAGLFLSWPSHLARLYRLSLSVWPAGVQHFSLVSASIYCVQ